MTGPINPGRKTMKAIVFCAAILAAFTSTAQAGLRQDCAASTGAMRGAAFNACMRAGKANSNQHQRPLHMDAGDRARCRMGHC
jgi:hypothetical protein